MYLYIIYIYVYTYISWWHPASKNLLRLEAGYPALRCHNLKNKTQVTRTTHTTQEPPHYREDEPQRLEKIPPGPTGT